MWTEFYKERVNSSYQMYFEKRYEPFLAKILDINPLIAIEEGCGIGSISKFLLSEDIDSFGYDIDPQMVDLANVNTNTTEFYKDDILKPVNYPNIIKSHLIITHGVLEHFTDQEIKQIFDRYKKLRIPSIHYVPLDKYKIPSFGDERLMSHEFWLEISKADEYQLFNDDYDLWFLIK